MQMTCIQTDSTESNIQMFGKQQKMLICMHACKIMISSCVALAESQQAPEILAEPCDWIYILILSIAFDECHSCGNLLVAVACFAIMALSLSLLTLHSQFRSFCSVVADLTLATTMQMCLNCVC